MPRPPSKHGLERKYKPWRKGKSATSKSKGSLKHQLRGKERLLAKVSEQDTERRKELEEQIKAIKSEIDDKQVVEKTRQNAKDSHGLRFLERQRLVRTERSTRKLLASASTDEERARYEAELQRIALDQVYVAHFPHDMRYIPLFRNGVRMVDVNRKLVKRATTRKRILKNLSEDDRVKWIPADQYERIPVEWSVEVEKSTFAAPAKGDTAEAEINDNRFAASLPQHAALLEAAERAEAVLRKEAEKNKDDKDSDSLDESNSDSSSSDDEANPLTGMQNEVKNAKQGDDLGDDDSSDSDSSSDDEGETTLPKSKGADESSDSSSDDSSSESDSSVEHESTAAVKKRSTETRIDEDFDDFLMPANEEIDVFEKAKQDAPVHDYSGDKSKGWATQRQRPGQFKKRRVR